MKKVFFLIAFFCLSFLIDGTKLFSQSPNLIDSLVKVLKNVKQDTSSIKNLNVLAWELKYENVDTSIVLSKKALEFSDNLNWEKGRAQSFHNIGLFNYLKGDYKEAQLNYNKALYVLDKLERKNKGAGKEMLALKAKTMGYSGLVFSNEGNMLRALEFYLEALKIDERLQNNSGIARHVGNIGIVYYELKKFDKSLEYYFKALKLAEQTGYIQLQANTLGNIGIVYSDKGDKTNALDYFHRALELADNNGFKELQANTLENIGTIYVAQKNYSKALERFQMALKIKEEGGSKRDIAISLNYIGNTYLQIMKLPEAEKYLMRAKQFVDSIGTVSLKKETYKGLATVYFLKKDWKKAYEHYSAYVVYHDTIQSQQNQRDMSRKEIEFEYAKKASQDSIKNAEERKTNAALVKVRDEQLKRAALQRYALFGGVALLVVFGIFMYSRFKITQKQKTIIELQKTEVEEKNKEILDSITYAKRLQEAILPATESIKKYLPESFVLYKPKDIVAGDFYYFEVAITSGKDKSEALFLAAADCTGHGVPGALVSVVCSNALNRCIKELHVTETGKILDKTRDLVLETFTKSSQDVKDGMDISLCSITPLSTGAGRGARLQWSGANNPLWYIKKKSPLEEEDSQNGSGDVLVEIDATKQPIGKTENPKPFVTHSIDLQKGDMFYLFTDGFADQFGGPKKKKFKYKPFKDLLLSICNLPPDEQRTILEEHFINWRGELEQVDDVCIIGVRV